MRAGNRHFLLGIDFRIYYCNTTTYYIIKHYFFNEKQKHKIFGLCFKVFS